MIVEKLHASGREQLRQIIQVVAQNHGKRYDVDAAIAEVCSMVNVPRKASDVVDMLARVLSRHEIPSEIE